MSFQFLSVRFIHVSEFGSAVWLESEISRGLIFVSISISKWWFWWTWINVLSIMTWRWSWYPPTYYNHFIEHPILWSRERRRWEDQKLAYENFSVWKAQERIRRSEKPMSEVWKRRQEKQKKRSAKKNKIQFWIINTIFYVASLNIDNTQ